ncbi:hypothetical protein SDRG_13475 [Saprolegnia diclina VS20]|uniref:HIT-type domain-containing protein n=1 Tax=Saprolegnia diclina (strain VS20) TaxID=1156394 RepID=T0R9H3_SAPDV|nr:hypothetical protein SDRG_13475 [Saprolegnia diclina VS20]EQC28793.1 hypothetical protein SDRG_13475 [Saprolegnia diclina VS20]|eukprot:XP_008617788.1 hypothetical protein SDRG_13475 [Saprolegnia diclina VS20]
MSSKNAKRQWDQTMASSGLALPAAPRKRNSGRAVKISKAMKLVDEETRKQVRNARLDALEADNYVEPTEDGEDEDLYIEEDAMGPKKPSKSRAKGKAKAPIVPVSSSGRRRVVRKVKSLAQLVFEECGTGEGLGPNYVTAAVKPATTPPRKFCVVCGLFSNYACGRCGSRFCSVKCGDQHRETGCLKFSM